MFEQLQPNRIINANRAEVSEVEEALFPRVNGNQGPLDKKLAKHILNECKKMWLSPFRLLELLMLCVENNTGKNIRIKTI